MTKHCLCYSHNADARVVVEAKDVDEVIEIFIEKRPPLQELLRTGHAHVRYGGLSKVEPTGALEDSELWGKPIN